ncbi:hypothetical protein CANMA_004767 [Candida margitis]|uniref:uncharacterized protein n=1 Tax=Candida margitis TaxID=1775924 RepID=UPI002225D2C1|nr:uncharacterized protein CANMA_004767 [Candida margitis]KAI5953928.1 hypothetical protein CANMA_004767 [Candida margitis]
MCYTSFPKVARMKSLEDRAAKMDITNDACNKSKDNHTPFIVETSGNFYGSNEKTPLIDLEGQREAEKEDADPLREIAELIVASKMKKIKLYQKVFVWFVIALGISRSLWMFILNIRYELSEVFTSKYYLGVLSSLYIFRGVAINLQHYLITVTLRNLQNSNDLNQHNVCNIGCLPRLMFGIGYSLSISWSLWVALFCPLSEVMFLIIIVLCCSALISLKVNKVDDNADVEELLQKVVQGKSERGT